MFPMNNTVASPSHIGLDLVGIEAGAPLDLDLRVESVSEGVLVSGTLSAPITGRMFALPDTVQPSASRST